MLQMYHNFLLFDFDIHICYSWDLQETFATLQISNKIKAYIDILVKMMSILIIELVINVSIFVTGAIGIDIGMPKDHILPYFPSKICFSSPDSFFRQLYHFWSCNSVTFVSFIVNSFERLVTATSSMYQDVLLICAWSIYLRCTHKF